MCLALMDPTVLTNNICMYWLIYLFKCIYIKNNLQLEAELYNNLRPVYTKTTLYDYK